MQLVVKGTIDANYTIAKGFTCNYFTISY